MTKDKTIDRIWELSGHGTRREDVEAATMPALRKNARRARRYVMKLHNGFD
jgi:hypothetical protein